jgi:phage replication O-like protein O
MPKGDRQRLKADPEDGTTPVANLLLEAVAMAKLSGQEKGAILCLWRQTYGWAEPNKKRRKECKFTLSDWGKALDITRFRASDVLANLVAKNVIFRRTADQWGGYYYRLNTNIAAWNSNTINLAKLAESVKIADFGDVIPDATVIPQNTVTADDTVTKEGTVRQKNTEQLRKTVTPQLQRTTHPTLYKEILKKVKEIYTVWNEQKIIVHKKLTDDTERTIRTTLKDYSKEEICQAIRNYAEILKGDQYFFKYSWTLKDFLRRGLPKFLDLGVAKKNYLRDRESGTHRQDIKRPPGKTPTVYHDPDELRHG